MEEMEELTDLAVRGLEELIDFQNYPVKAAKVSTKNEGLGIGYIGLAHFLAKTKSSTVMKAWKLVHELTESFQYHLLKSSNKLAQIKGECGYFDRTKYAEGELPIDHYKKEVDEIAKPVYKMKWDKLRKDIQVHGLRHSTLTAQMPSESPLVLCLMQRMVLNHLETI